MLHPAVSTKLGAAANMPEDCAAIQRDLSRLENWNGTEFDKGKCRMLHPGRRNPQHRAQAGA